MNDDAEMATIDLYAVGKQFVIACGERKIKAIVILSDDKAIELYSSLPPADSGQLLLDALSETFRQTVAHANLPQPNPGEEASHERHNDSSANVGGD